MSARSVVSGIQKKLAATRSASAARSLFCAISASSLRKASKPGSLAVFGGVIGTGFYGPRAAEGGCGPGVAGTGVWEGASIWAKTEFRSTAPIIATVTMKLKQRRECCIAFSPAFGTKSIGATRADTYTLPPLRQAESPALSRSRHLTMICHAGGDSLDPR